MSDKLHISWERYENEIEELAIKVWKDGYKFNQVICIAKGGLRVGDVFAREFPNIICPCWSFTSAP